MIRADFFQSDPLICAPGLIGATLVWGRCAGVIVETEAYLAENDEAAHTFSRPSARAFIERNKAGAAYVYFNYGVHWMLNVLVKGGSKNGFVLIRALEPRCGIALMQKRRGLQAVPKLCSGPGKLTQALDITGRHHEMDLCRDPRRCFVERAEANVDVVADRRIGITRSADLPWRFTLRDSPFVSVRPKRSSKLKNRSKRSTSNAQRPTLNVGGAKTEPLPQSSPLGRERRRSKAEKLNTREREPRG